MDKAIADYSEAIRLKPKDGRAYNKRADAYFKDKAMGQSHCNSGPRPSDLCQKRQTATIFS